MQAVDELARRSTSWTFRKRVCQLGQHPACGDKEPIEALDKCIYPLMMLVTRVEHRDVEKGICKAGVHASSLLGKSVQIVIVVHGQIAFTGVDGADQILEPVREALAWSTFWQDDDFRGIFKMDTFGKLDRIMQDSGGDAHG